MNIKEALAKLDPFDDDHWTADGAPTIAAVTDAFGDKVTRKEITEADPLFSRETAGQLSDAESEAPAPEPEPVSDLDCLRDEQSFLEEENAGITKGMEEGKKLIKKNQQRLEAIADKILVLDPPQTQAEGIRAFIDASNASRAARHGVAQRVAASLPPGMAKVKAPIDEAYARRNKRGMTRPVR